MSVGRDLQGGFSILEALISMALFVGMMTIVMSVYVPSRSIYARGERKADMQQNARLAMSEMSRQIRMAGYFPENFSNPAPNPVTADPIVIAADDALAIHGDADNSGSSSVFLFCLDGDVLRRTRAAKAAAAAYVCAGGAVLAEGITDLRFTYYDAASNPIPDPPVAPFQLDDQDQGAVPSLDDTTQRGSIRRVVVTIMAETPSGHQQTQEFSLGSDVWLRNSR